jgi:hypothetical protein
MPLLPSAYVVSVGADIYPVYLDAARRIDGVVSNNPIDCFKPSPDDGRNLEISVHHWPLPSRHSGDRRARRSPWANGKAKLTG